MFLPKVTPEKVSHTGAIYTQAADEEPGFGTVMPGYLSASPAALPPGNLPYLLSIPKTPSSRHLHSRLFVPCGSKSHAGIILTFGEALLGAEGLQPENPFSGCQES